MSKIKNFQLRQIHFVQARDFVIRWHYSKTLPYCKYYFGLFDKNDLIGIAAYGLPAMRNQSKCYSCDIELRRLCLTDSAPKNSESRFISLTLKELKKIGHNAVLSLADPEHSHTGVIYKASNFEFLGLERGGGSRLIVIDGVPVHSRTAYAKYGTSGILSLKQMLGEDRVEGRNKKRKLVYRYILKKKLKTSIKK
jgi:hypothetical protein